mgnify:CR=1 FL=1
MKKHKLNVFGMSKRLKDKLMKNKVFIITIIAWVVATLFRMFNHIPWLDEAHAWTIAQDLSLVEIIKLMKIEGHTLIWYLMLMPFAKMDWGYPYVMQILNWVFCFGAIILLWKKAPFNNLVKVLITFSFPFFTVYPIIARCYSIGIFLLFLLTILFKDKLKYPIIYSILLVLCANTSVMALFGATAFGILFLYDFIKEKQDLKNLIIPLIIFVLGGGLILYLLVGSDATAITDYKGFSIFKEDVVLWYFIPTILCIIASIFLMRKSPKALFFLGFTYLALTYCSIFKYYGHYWNHYFYYIYLILVIWLGMEKEKSSKPLMIVLAIISLLNISSYGTINENTKNISLKGMSDIMIKEIISDSNFENKTIILDDIDSIGFKLLPYSKTKNINEISYCSGKGYDSNIKDFPPENVWCHFKDEDTLIQNNSSKRISSLMENKDAFLILYFKQGIYPEWLREVLKENSNLVAKVATFKDGKVQGNSFTWDNLKLTPYKCFSYEKTQVKCIWYVEKN